MALAASTDAAAVAADEAYVAAAEAYWGSPVDFQEPNVRSKRKMPQSPHMAKCCRTSPTANEDQLQSGAVDHVPNLGDGTECEVLPPWEPAYPITDATQAKSIAFLTHTLHTIKSKGLKRKLDKDLVDCAEVYGAWIAQDGGQWIADQGTAAGIVDDHQVPDSFGSSVKECLGTPEWARSQQGWFLNNKEFQDTLQKQKLTKELLQRNGSRRCLSAEEIMVVDEIAKVHFEGGENCSETNIAAAAHCKRAPMPLAMKGPGAVAWHLLQKAHCTEEQKDAVALLAWSLQKKFERRPDMSSHRLSLMDHEDNHRAIWLGGGTAALYKLISYYVGWVHLPSTCT